MRGIPGTEYICKRNNGVYELHRRIDGTMKYFGRSKSLISILMMRDWCENNGWKRFKHPNRNIYEDKKFGTYRIKKQFIIDGKIVNKYYGSFKYLNQAREYRDLCIEKNWDDSLLISNNPTANNPLKYIHKTRNGNYAISKTDGYKSNWYGVYPTLIDAIKERDLLIECDWDYDALCNVDERICDITVFNSRRV